MNKKDFYSITFKVWLINALIGALIGYYFNEALGAIAGAVAGGLTFPILLFIAGVLAGSAGLDPDDFGGE